MIRYGLDQIMWTGEAHQAHQLPVVGGFDHAFRKFARNFWGGFPPIFGGAK